MREPSNHSFLWLRDFRTSPWAPKNQCYSSLETPGYLKQSNKIPADLSNILLWVISFVGSQNCEHIGKDGGPTNPESPSNKCSKILSIESTYQKTWDGLLKHLGWKSWNGHLVLNMGYKQTWNGSFESWRLCNVESLKIRQFETLKLCNFETL